MCCSIGCIGKKEKYKVGKQIWTGYSIYTLCQNTNLPEQLDPHYVSQLKHNLAHSVNDKIQQWSSSVYGIETEKMSFIFSNGRQWAF
jgi:hypothetical protein